jgi:hypothetical protein
MQIAKFSFCVFAFALCGAGALYAADTPAQAAARTALLKQLQATATNPPTAKPAPAAPPVKAAAVTNTPPPIPMTKEQKLQELLVKYKANQLTPQQYHEQRAAILAKP